jgi:hypothetical protein
MKFSIEDRDIISPRDYAIKRKLQPQQVYYYIRIGVIESHDCVCGRNVIDAVQADEALKAHREKKA